MGVSDRSPRYPVSEFLPKGVRILWYEAEAPAGWKVVSVGSYRMIIEKE